VPQDKLEGVSHRRGAIPRIKAILTLFAKTAELFFGGLLRRIVVVLILIMAAFLPAASAGEKPSRWRVAWHVSQVLLAGSQVADAASSWGKLEANPLLQTSPRFGYGALALKFGALAVSLTAQHFMVRKNPGRIRFFTCTNLAVTGMLTGVTVHNTRVP